jgi:hypothetical protein
MVTRTKEALEYEETELLIEVPESEVSLETQEKAQAFIDNYVSMLMERTEAHVAGEQAKIEMGAPGLASGYQYWNCLTIGPIQFTGNPPYRPNKIIAAGEPALLLGVIWINPANSDGGGLPGTIVLGARDYRARFETVNLTQVSMGPNSTTANTFASPAPVVTAIPWFFTPADPGVNPHLMEINFTADVTIPGQPFAAFSTWHFDLDREPPFLGIPDAPAHWQFERPARCLVFRQ